MLKILLTSFFNFFVLQAFGQLNLVDSTIHIRLNWKEGDKHNYILTTDKYKLNGIDTISHEGVTCDVEITVVEKTERSYTIQCLYQNIESNSKNPIIQRLAHMYRPKEIIFKTDESGKSIEVVNWKDIEEHIDNVIHILRKEFQGAPELEIIISQFENMYANTESYRFSATKDMQQFLLFHGRHYKHGAAITETIKVPDFLGTELLDADLTLQLQKVNDDESLFTLTASQEVNSEQLAISTYNNLKTIAKNMNNDPPKKKDIKGLSYTTMTSSSIYRSGWVDVSVQTTIAGDGSISNLEKRTIQKK